MLTSDDPIVSQFMTVYGLRDLLEDQGREKISRLGEYWMCSCPFHENNRTPDFQIHSTLGLWNCFGCHVKGNMYQYIMMSYNISYKQAREFLMKLAGFDANVNIEDLMFSARLRNMFKTDEEKEPLKKSRPLTPEVIAQFNTGPDPYNYLAARGFSDETIAYFECTFTNKWRVWDEHAENFRYEERVVIPGHLDDGKLKGFIGRTPVGDEPKYRYTAGYEKSHHLFNLHRAKNHSEEGLIAVEGSLDAIQIHNLGFPNVISIYGASISHDQIRLICKYTNKIYLAFDNDIAGQTATVKAIEALKDYIDVNVISLDKFKDPGEIHDASVFESMLRGASNYRAFDFHKQIRKGL